MAITPEQLAELEATWSENRARQEKLASVELLKKGEFTIELVRMAGDPPAGAPAFQEELNRFGASLRAEGIPYRQTAIAMDAVDAHGFPLPEFILAIKVLGPPVIAGLAACAGAWVQARYGRKARLRIGEIEAEAATVAEIEKLLQMAAVFPDRDKKPAGDGEPCINSHDTTLRPAVRRRDAR